MIANPPTSQIWKKKNWFQWVGKTKGGHLEKFPCHTWSVNSPIWIVDVSIKWLIHSFAW
jgi:hypothetical protein